MLLISSSAWWIPPYYIVLPYRSLPALTLDCTKRRTPTALILCRHFTGNIASLGPPVAITQPRPLCFAAVSFFLFLQREIAKFCHRIRNGCNFKNYVSNLGVLPKNNLGPKHAFFGAISDDFALRSRISPERNKISKSENGVANYDLSRVCWRNLVNFGPQTAKNRTVVCAYPIAST